MLGGDKRARTAGLLRARQALSQLSYTPTSSDSVRSIPFPPSARIPYPLSNPPLPRESSFRSDKGHTRIFFVALFLLFRIKPTSLGFHSGGLESTQDWIRLSNPPLPRESSFRSVQDYATLAFGFCRKRCQRSLSRRRWWAQVDSNHRPHDYQSCALTS